MSATVATRAVAAALLAVVLGACSSATDPATDGPTDGPTDRATDYAADQAGGYPDPALAGEPTPTLPPGDPGTDADGVADGHGAEESTEGGDAHGEHAGDSDEPAVPPGALLDAATVGSLTGGTWREGTSAGTSGCDAARPAAALAARGITLVATGGALTEWVGAYADPAAASAAVARTADRLAACGFTRAGDPRLGEASLELTRAGGAGAARAMVVAADGATAVVLGTGSVAAPGAWESVVDIALGTSCAAAPHGCH